MPPKRRFILCEICGDRVSHEDQEKRKFMVKFPLDEARCRQWIKLVGKDDLIYVPIEKLHTLKYNCGDHFRSKYLNKKKNRLKKISMALMAYEGFNAGWMERIILQLGDAFEIRIAWDRDSAIVVGAFAVAGGLIGHYAGGRLGAALGASVSSIAALGVSAMVALREIWASIKNQLQELLFIVYNYLRQLDPIDYLNAFELLMACSRSKRDLVITILDFIATKLGREVFSNITAA